MKKIIFRIFLVTMIIMFTQQSPVFAYTNRFGDSSIKENTKHVIHYESTIEYISSNQSKKEIVLVIDTSESMRQSVSGNSLINRINVAKAVAIDFVEKFYKTETKIAIVAFSDKTRTQGFTDMNDTGNKPLDAVKQSIVKLSMNNGTNIAEGLNTANDLLNNGSDAEKYIILLTDGEPSVYLNDKGKTIWDSKKSLEKTVEIGKEISKTDINSFVVGFTSDISKSSLESISNSLNTNYLVANNITEIYEIYKQISLDIKHPILTAKYYEVLPIEVKTAQIDNENVKIKKEIIQGVERYVAEGEFIIESQDGYYNKNIFFDLIVTYHYKYSVINYPTNTLNVYKNNQSILQHDFNNIIVKIIRVIDIG